MTTFGFFLSCEEYGPRELVRQARMAQEAGFERLWISDHFHPWNDEQGSSPFVWSVIGALSEAVDLPIATAVTCPTMRMHPALVAQAAATAAVQTQGRLTLGVGTGEALNEHVLGDAWPSIGVRQSMLEEAVELIRLLMRGEEVSFDGRHYEVSDARLYTVPEHPVPIHVSGFGPQSIELAARIGDGFITMSPDQVGVDQFRRTAGAGKLVSAGLKVAWAPSEAEGVAAAHRLWPNSLLSGQLAQILPRPRDFEAATELVRPEQTAEHFACGPDPKRHLEALRPYLDVGFDELYVSQIGGNLEGFFKLWREEILPEVTDHAARN